MLKVQGILSKISTLMDRTVRIQLDLQEQPPENSAELFTHLQNFVNVAIVESSVDIDDSIDFPAVKEKGQEPKTPSQQLRNVLYRLYQFNPQGFTDFEDYYKSKMSEIVGFYKKRLSELNP